MVITQRPSNLNFSGNVPDIILDDVTEAVSFKLLRGNELILEEEYLPDVSGRARIRISKLIDLLLYTEVPDYSSTIYHQTNAYGSFRAEIDAETIEFVVIKGFLQRLDFDVDHFLTYNWLTTQPTEKTVKFHDPEWLTCYPRQTVSVRIRATFASGSTQTVTYGTLQANKVQSINLNPGIVLGLFSQEPVQWEVFTEASGQQRQYIQTYRYSLTCDEYDDLFVFENRLGGVDTIRFTGTSSRIDSTLFENARFDDFVVDFFAEPELTVEKNTGPIATKAELNHALDFFRSVRKHHLTRGFLAGIYLSDKPTLESTKGTLNSYTFNYSYSDFKVAYPEIAIPPKFLELPE